MTAHEREARDLQLRVRGEEPPTERRVGRYPGLSTLDIDLNLVRISHGHEARIRPHAEHIAHVDGGGRLREDVPVLDDDERAELIDSGLQGDLAVRPDAHDSVASGREDEGLAWPSHPVRAATGDRKRERE